MTRAEHALLTRRIAQAVHQAAIEATDAELAAALRRVLADLERRHPRRRPWRSWWTR